MRTSAFVLCGIILASCSRAADPWSLPANTQGVESPLSAQQPSSERPPSNSGYKLLYAFKGGTADGAAPAAGLIAVNGALYGTTSSGGANGAGTIFTITSSGSEKLLYSFGSDGYSPQALLLAVDDKLYGATAGSPSSGYCGGDFCGTVFEVSISGKERALYTFKGGSDGYSPSGGLIDVNGKLYGTTWGGGSSTGCSGYGCGTVFEITTSGKERVLYRFKGSPDGGWPYGGLTDVNGTLYGTTDLGGKYCIGSGGSGCGTVFAVSTSGRERVLYSFRGSADGEYPQANLLALNGSLYGTTSGGGSGVCTGIGCGTIFEVSASGKERVLYRFKEEPDGNTPLVGLIAANGTLYGTTSWGGKSCGSSGLGCGTVFKTTTAGKESVLYRFRGGKDGVWLRASLFDLNGVLYGTTYYGGVGKGCGASGCGTVYRISP